MSHTCNIKLPLDAQPMDGGWIVETKERVRTPGFASSELSHEEVQQPGFANTKAFVTALYLRTRESALSD
jgi:hypothetical protein